MTEENKGSTLVAIIPLALIIGCIIWTIYLILPIPSGSVTGEFVSCEVRPWGDFCGQYPWTRITLRNYSVTGEIDDWDNDFYFDGEYYEVEDLTVGSVYKFTYKIGSRPSDTTSGDSITQYYLLGINKEV